METFNKDSSRIQSASKIQGCLFITNMQSCIQIIELVKQIKSNLVFAVLNQINVLENKLQSNQQLEQSNLKYLLRDL